MQIHVLYMPIMDQMSIPMPMVSYVTGSLHSERFRASWSRKLGREQKKKRNEGGGGSSRSNFRAITRLETLATRSNFRAITRLETLATQASQRTVIQNIIVR